MDVETLAHAIELLEKANAELEPELLRAADARTLLALYAKGERLCSFGTTALTRKLDDTTEVARTTGTSIGRARQVVEIGKIMAQSPGSLHGAAARRGVAGSGGAHRRGRAVRTGIGQAARRSRSKRVVPGLQREGTQDQAGRRAAVWR